MHEFLLPDPNLRPHTLDFNGLGFRVSGLGFRVFSPKPGPLMP